MAVQKQIMVEVNQKNEIVTSKNTQDYNFHKFKPDSISNIKIDNFSIDYSYLIDNYKIVVGYYTPINGELSKYDSKENWGDRLFVLNKKDDIIFKGQGVGDVYLYEPYFYKNNNNNKTIIVCHLGYEYFFGGDVFLIENEKIEYVGNIDIEGKYEKTNLIDILRITESENRIVFSFDSDSITYKPGNEDAYIKNNNIRYEYFNKKMKLIK